MKKKINKIIICLIGMVYILMILKANTSVAYTYTRPNNNNWRDSIVVWNSSTTSDPKTVTLSDGKKVALVQGGYKTDAIYRSSDGALQCSIVCQPNIYCAQHGTGLSQGSYRASKKFNVDTNQYAGRVLAYILNQNKSTSLSKDWVTPYQVALWKYLYNYKDKDNATDAKRIVNNITINNATSVNEAQDLSQDDLDQADKLITAADEYATNLNVTPTLSVSKENGNIKITTNAKKYEIYLSGKLYKEGENSQFTGTKSISISTALKYTSTGQVTVQVKSLVTQYKASYRILYSYYDEYDKWPAGQQRVIVVTGLETTTKRNASTTVTEALDANVSMQKYITSVSDINGNNKTTVDSRDSYLSRENDMNNNDSDSLGVVYKTKYDRDPSKSKSKKTPYKYDNPVKIDYGDKVTYTIEVSNNGAYPVENVVIRDAFPKIGDNIVVDINSIELNKNGNEMNTSSIPNSGMNYLISNSIAAGETKKFTITMKFNSDALKQRTDIIANTAWVEAVYSNVNGSVGLKGKNLKRDYRTADRDYVQMKQYEVNLEKYVVGVNGYRLEDFNDDRSVNAQDGLLLSSGYITNNETMTGFTDSVKNKIQRYGDVNKDGIISGNDTLFITNMAVGATSIQNCREGSAIWYDTTSKYKENHPVQVETGDEVTFKIKLTNTGEGNIKVSKITDTFTFTNDATKKISLLESSITGNGGGTISGDIITFNNPEEIETGKSIFVEVKLKVTTDLKEEYELENTAEITEMKNRNNQSILPWDNDGTTNNKDTDYLKVLKQYAVGLNKFITKVNNADLIIETSNPQYNCNSADRSGLSKTDKSTDANKVRVEPGDTVTYTLRLTNTSPTDGGHSAIKVSKIEDIPQKINNNCYLDCDSSYEIKENGGGTVAKNGNKLTITFSKPEEIYPGKYLDITIRFKVVVKDTNTVTNTATYQTLENAATVTEIKNRNNITVNDVDGTDNNSNSDYIKTKIYKISLEKYVTQVNGNALSKEAGANYNVKSLSERNGNPIYDSTNKENDIVNLETGDTVTFAITIKNIGDDHKNYGTVKTLNITDTSSKELKYNKVCQGARYNNGTITRVPSIAVGNEATIYLGYTVTLDSTQTKEKIDLVNTATINSNTIKNKHDVLVKEDKNSRQDEDNTDSDYLRTKVYAVSLEKFVSKVEMNGTDITDAINMGPQKEGMDRPREGYAEHNYNNSETTEENCDKTKRRNPVTTVTGDTITYTIKLKNDSDEKTGIDTTKDSNNDKNSYNTAIQIGNVIDYLPNGMQYDNNKYTNDNYKVTYDFETSNGQTLSSGRLLQPGETATVTITAEVIEDKMSLNILKNVAEIDKNSLTNKNEKKVYDTTENNNKDADYIQLNYKHDPNPNNPDANPDPNNNAFFAGTVWNDMAFNKPGDKYNGEINTEERKLKGIKVFLYRDEYGLVADTATDGDGKYSFGDNDLQNEKNDKYFEKDFKKDDMSARYIKGPKKSKDDNRWDGYYSYYIVFAYDGITYTATPNGNTCADIFKNITDTTYQIDSNAKEDNGMYTINKKSSRKDFNTNISKMVQARSISYDTKNDANFIPESRYQYDENTMTIQSSTEEIKLKDFMKTGTDKCLECSKYIGLGLRGRDIFDLELTSDVSRVEVTVNNIVGNYEYTNKVNVRKEDVNSNYLSDMANSYTSSLEEGAQYVQTAKNGDENDSQVVRKTDLKTELTNTNKTAYDDSNLLNSIYVIYKISVNNASPTPGYATQIVDYYDKKYQLEGVYTDEKCNSDSKYTKYINYSDESTSDYNYVIVKDLKEVYNIYVKLQLKNAKKVLTENAWDKGMATYNMAEIYQYETGINKEKGQTEYTRGLIDKDSAPGSAATETVRLTNGSSKDKTVEYYFKGDSLEKLKYEDDTYATPTLYFTTDSSIRVIEGNVFEDLTDVVPERAEESTLQRKRSGDGVWQKDTEPAIDGITVQLYEGDILRYETTTQYDSTTKTGGYYKFAGFLPGNYTLRYYYGKSDETFYINPGKNEKSYNGEDFQATNNNTAITYTYNGKKYTIKSSEQCLDTKENTWYSNNENGVSVANDETTRRKEVINNVCNYTDYEMQVLNNVRDGKNKDNATEYDNTERKYIKPDTIKDETWMSATTKNMLFSVEQTSKHVVSNKFGTYAITKMNFGIAEVPISTIDLQKHVNQFEIKDSTGKNTIAKATVEEDQSTIKINPSKITDTRKQTNVEKALKSAEINYNSTDVKINGANEEIELTVKAEKNVAEAVETLRKEMTKYSLGSIIKIIPKWKVEGNVLTGVKSTSTVLDVSIEDAKLQGAKLQVTYDISATIYAEKNYNKGTALVPTIDGLIDCIDNNLSYNDLENTENNWQVVRTDSVNYGESGRGISEMTKYTTILNAERGNGLLLKNIGTGTAKITLERVLTSTDSTISNIITSSIEAFEYENTVQITKINYDNMTDEGITYKDRVRTPDRYIVLPGVGHYSATSETIAIHPPTGDTSTHTMYYIIGAAGLAVLAIGAFGIKKFVLKGKSTKK